MKFTTTLLLSMLTLAVTARKHRLCCCTKKDECGLVVCDGAATDRVVQNGNGMFIRSTRDWNKGNGAPCGGSGSKGWLYAADATAGDDGYVGGDEMSDRCDLQHSGSRCFSPEGNWRNNPQDLYGGGRVSAGTGAKGPNGQYAPIPHGQQPGQSGPPGGPGQTHPKRDNLIDVPARGVQQGYRIHAGNEQTYPYCVKIV